MKDKCDEIYFIFLNKTHTFSIGLISLNWITIHKLWYYVCEYMKSLLKLLLLFQVVAQAGVGIDNPIMFVTQFPVAQDFTTIGSTFGNHLASIQSVGRGGDLYIRYADGTLRNLTREAGFGNAGDQRAGAIAVRDPTVHWDGTKALFSMVIGAPTEQFEVNEYYWQMYEISGFGLGQTVVITKVANQATNYNNITPIYGSDGHIIFTSDMPRTKNRFNYPQHDEYESSPTNTGLWKLDVNTGISSLLQHSPSGSFSPFIGSGGRLIFTRWDHLQRDQQASPVNNFDNFNYSNENPGAIPIDTRLEVFPEPRPEEVDLLAGTNLEGLRFNHFFPWELNQDGTEEETLNHVGRHEFFNFFNRAINDDTNVVAFSSGNTNDILNTFMLHEDPNQAGRFLAIEAPEFATHSSGMIIAFSLPHGDLRPDLVSVDFLTHPSTRDFVVVGNTPDPEHVGLFRDPIILTNSTIIASHTAANRQTPNGVFVDDLYDFKIKSLNDNLAGDLVPTSNLMTLGNVNLTFFDPDNLITYNGPLWELQATEVVVSTQPEMTVESIATPELDIFAEENVNQADFRNYLKEKNLAVVVMRDITTRDEADRQQPFNLRVANSNPVHETIGVNTGTVYEISHMQFFQADQIRGSGLNNIPIDPGQRVLAQYLHDENAVNSNIPFAGAPVGSVEIFPDGSVSAFVPARRAMAWQSLDLAETPIVRERYWITFQPGEIRACGGCHGVNNLDQAGQLLNTQKAQAFRALLQHWKQNLSPTIFANGFEE